MVTLNTITERGKCFLMARTKLRFDQFGIAGDPEMIADKLVDAFNVYARGQLTIDELLLHPRDALAFCDQVRAANGWFGLPDDMVLRPILTRRKNPS